MKKTKQSKSETRDYLDLLKSWEFLFLLLLLVPVMIIFIILLTGDLERRFFCYKLIIAVAISASIIWLSVILYKHFFIESKATLKVAYMLIFISAIICISFLYKDAYVAKSEIDSTVQITADIAEYDKSEGKVKIGDTWYKYYTQNTVVVNKKYTIKILKDSKTVLIY